jgi:hypothetical protein
MIPILSFLSPILDKVLDKIPNVQEREKARLEFQLQIAENETKLIELFTQVDSKQIEVNIEEAKSNSLFVSGWRPWIGWVSGAGVTWAFVLKPIADWILAVSGSLIKTPTLETGELMSLLLGLLGMGALRSYEKIKGVASK